MKKSNAKKAGLILLFILLALAFGVVVVLPKLYKSYLYPKKYNDYVEMTAKKYDFDEDMIYAVIRTESRFNPNAVSDVGATGLMQLMPDAYEWVRYRMKDERDITYEDMSSPDYNIEYGTYLLKLLYDEYGDYETALAAYHAGRGSVNNWLKDPENSSDGKILDKKIPSSATAHYVYKVMHAYDVYSKIYE